MPVLMDFSIKKVPASAISVKWVIVKVLNYDVTKGGTVIYELRFYEAAGADLPYSTYSRANGGISTSSVQYSGLNPYHYWDDSRSNYSRLSLRDGALNGPGLCVYGNTATHLGWEFLCELTAVSQIASIKMSLRSNGWPATLSQIGFYAYNNISGTKPALDYANNPANKRTDCIELGTYNIVDPPANAYVTLKVE